MPASTRCTASPSALRLRPGPLPGEKVLYTGDLCRLDEDGYLYFVARMDDIIKSRGEKVAPKEVETALYDVEGVKEVAVISTPSPPFRSTSSARTPPDVGEPRPSHPQVLLAIEILAATTARETRVSGKPLATFPPAHEARFRLSPIVLCNSDHYFVNRCSGRAAYTCRVSWRPV